MEIIKDAFIGLSGYIAISLVLDLAMRIFMVAAISQDCKARMIKAKNTYCVLTFFFPFIVGIVYACTRKKAQALPTVSPDHNPKKHAKNSIICFIVVVILYLSSVGVGVYMNFSGAVDDFVENISSGLGFDDLTLPEEYRYDRNGAYYEDGNIPLFDRDNNKYVYEEAEDIMDDSYYVCEQTGEKFESYFCYVDKDGYFYYDKNDELEFASEDSFDMVDKDGNVYYTASSTYWDATGALYSRSSIELD